MIMSLTRRSFSQRETPLKPENDNEESYHHHPGRQDERLVLGPALGLEVGEGGCSLW